MASGTRKAGLWAALVGLCGLLYAWFALGGVAGMLSDGEGTTDGQSTTGGQASSGGTGPGSTQDTGGSSTIAGDGSEAATTDEGEVEVAGVEVDSGTIDGMTDGGSGGVTELTTSSEQPAAGTTTQVE